MTVNKGPDVVGYIWEHAQSLLEDRGLTVHKKYVGKSLGAEPLRVIRQRFQEGGTVELTCAHENWQANLR